jgi:branched-chain amino acid aminotransferase
MSSPRFAFFQGKIVPIEQAKVSVMTHALNYGTAVFGGMRGYWNEAKGELYLFRPLDHFARLKQSAEMILMNVPYTPEQLRAILVDLLRHEGYRQDTYIRPLVYKSHEGIGVRLHNLEHDLTIFAIPFGSYLEHEEGLKLGTSTWRRVDDTAIPVRGKISGAYVNSALIKTEVMLNGHDEALVLNQDGHVSEASAANLFMLRNGKVITPPVHANILEGIVRRTLCTLIPEQMGYEVIEREIDRSELYVADEIFLCGTGVQVAAVAYVDHRPIGGGKMGEFVRALRELFFNVVRGKVPQYAHWLYPVYASEAISAD